jgi:hypothetical protein
LASDHAVHRLGHLFLCNAVLPVVFFGKKHRVEGGLDDCLVDVFEGGMEAPAPELRLDVEPLGLPALIDVQIPDDGTACLIAEGAGGTIADPAVEPPPPTEHKEEVLIPEVVFEEPGQHLGRARHQGPALVADALVLAAGADVVVVADVHVEHELLLQRVEDRAAVLRLRWDVIDAADVDLLGLLARQVLLQLRGVRERSKSEVNISGEGERELPPREVLGASIPQPLDELGRREKPLEVELEIILAERSFLLLTDNHFSSFFYIYYRMRSHRARAEANRQAVAGS